MVVDYHFKGLFTTLRALSTDNSLYRNRNMKVHRLNTHFNILTIKRTEIQKLTPRSRAGASDERLSHRLPWFLLVPSSARLQTRPPPA